ncbi:MAG: hypothetical protein PHP45_00225 [Elusimicrobiales bacterium]|nr:hypothetical protein [Elusimicrobiales bacterium]
MGNLKFKTDFLFPKSSFVGGMGSVMNLAGNYFEFNGSDTPEEADARAIRADWCVVGQDLQQSINHLANTCATEKQNPTAC